MTFDTLDKARAAAVKLSAAHGGAATVVINPFKTEEFTVQLYEEYSAKHTGSRGETVYGTYRAQEEAVKP